MTGITLSTLAVTTVSAQAHEVEKGESLWGIAEEYNTTVEELVQINDLKTTVIQPKQIIDTHDTYYVERGDTLISISKEYDVKVDDLMEWNELKTPLIVIGQELQIEGKNVNQNQTSQKQSESTKEEKTETKASEKNPEGKTLTVTATAYTADCNGCSGITYTGIDLKNNRNAKVIAVDPDVIPLGSEVYVEGYGYAIAADIGSAIKGKKIDLHVPTKNEALDWGVRSVELTIVEKSD